MQPHRTRISMAIIIKEIHVDTVVEKKMVQATDIDEQVYRKMKEEILRELSGRQQKTVAETKKKER